MGEKRQTSGQNEVARTVGAKPSSPKLNQSNPAPIIECPPELSPLARQEWDLLVAHLAATGVLTQFDRGPLAIYCAAYGLWIEAIGAIEKHGSMIKSPSGYPVHSPYLAIANRQAEIMTRIAAEFGFTPASRGRLWMMSSSGPKLVDLEELSEGKSTW
jgi:P27 family predicted phage terminase small subunit